MWQPDNGHIQIPQTDLHFVQPPVVYKTLARNGRYSESGGLYGDGKSNRQSQILPNSLRIEN